MFKIRKKAKKKDVVAFPLKDKKGNLQVDKIGINGVINDHFVKVCEQEKRLAYKINCFLVSLAYMTSGLIILIEGINHLNIFADLISTRLTISWNVRISWKNGFFRK